MDMFDFDRDRGHDASQLFLDPTAGTVVVSVPEARRPLTTEVI